MTDDGIVGLFVGLHAVALHQPLGRIHLYETVCIYHLPVAVPVECVGEGMFSLDEILDVNVAIGKPLLLPGNGIVAGSVGIDLCLEQTVGRVAEHLKAAAIYLIGMLHPGRVFVVIAVHTASTHIICEVGPLEAARNHTFHRLHRSHAEVDGRNISIGAFARSKGTDDDKYEK